MKIKKYLEKCGEFSEDLKEREEDWYVRDDGKNIKKISNEGMLNTLATYLFDRSFAVDEESWEYLEKIADVFGTDIGYQVLKNMFYRNHDT